MYREHIELEVRISDKSIAMGLIKPIYKIITPTKNGNFNNQWNSCLQQILALSVDAGVSPIRVNIFVYSENQADYLQKQAVVKSTFKETLGNQCPPFGVVMQEPEDPYMVICEVGLVENHAAKVIYGFFHEIPYCIVDSVNYKEYWTIGAQSVHPNLNISASSEAAFAYLNDLYQHLELNLNNIVRQWNYVGEILSKEVVDNRQRQHYQMFNEVRSKYYGRYRTRKDFPAATGIGMLYMGVCIDSFAVSGDESLKIIAISNPEQSESYCYRQEVLVGAPDTSRKQNQPPQFERAKLLVLNNASRLIVSGTASIIGQKTIGIDDVEEQTRITIQNIQRLSSAENLLKHCPDIKSMPVNYSYIRVYVKYKDDISKVRQICSAFFGDVPSTYVVADICRDDLLVEIETELIS